MSKTIQEYTPLNSMITIIAPELSDKTEGGILKSEAMLQEEREKFTGELMVAHCGPTVPLNPKTGEAQIVPGDMILLASNAMMTKIKINNNDYWQVDSHQVLGVVSQ